MHLSFFIGTVLCVFGNEKKLVVLLVYCSFKRVATIILRSNSALTSQVIQAERKLGVNTDSFRIQ